MPRIIKRPRALSDLVEIWDYIADDSEANADGFLEKIEEKIVLLSSQPLMGRARVELMENMRSFPVDRYVVFYRPLPDGIEIIRVLHGARDIPTMFQEEK